MSDRVSFKAAVFIIVYDAEGRVLLQRRENTGYMDGYYDFPSGHIELGESMPTAAVRELAEETGLTVAEEDLRLVHLNQNIIGDYYLNYHFEAVKWKGVPVIGEPDRCSDVQFFPVDALPPKCTVSVRDIARAGFSHDLTYSVVDAQTHQTLMGEPLAAT